MSLFDNACKGDLFISVDSAVYVYESRLSKNVYLLFRLPDEWTDTAPYYVTGDGTHLFDRCRLITGPYVKPTAVIKDRQTIIKDTAIEFNDMTDEYKEVSDRMINQCKEIIMEHLRYVNDKGDICYHDCLCVGELPDGWENMHYQFLSSILKSHYSVYGYRGTVEYLQFTFKKNKKGEYMLEGITACYPNGRCCCVFGYNGYGRSLTLDPKTIMSVTKLVINFSHLLDIPLRRED